MHDDSNGNMMLKPNEPISGMGGEGINMNDFAMNLANQMSGGGGGYN
jgi:hypothetical protein